MIAFLRDLAPGDWIEVETHRGKISRYRVVETSIVDQSDARVLDAGDAARLTLITCYPFNYVGKAPRRFIVRAARTSTSLQPSE